MRHITAKIMATLMALSSLLITQHSHAADYPRKPVTIVVGYAAGGPTDILARAIAPRLSAMWNQPVIVDNRSGANEVIAAQLVSKAPPDGHTLMLSTETPLTQNQYLYSKLTYNPETDFSPVTQLLTSPMALVINARVPANTVQQFIALAKNRAASQPIAYGSAGAGGVLHLPMAMFAKQHELSMTHVPYKGLAPLINDLLAGQVDVAWMAVAAAAPYLQDGKLRALIVDAPERVKVMPDVPLFQDSQLQPVHAKFIFALMAPAGTPTAVTNKISADIRSVMAAPAFRAKYLDPFGFVPVNSTPAEFASYLAKDRPTQAERIKISGAAFN